MRATLLIGCLLISPVASAQTVPEEALTVVLEALPQLPVHPPQPLQIPATPFHRPERPPALMPLYGSFAALQGLDIYTTRRAIDRGADEGNPMMRGAAQRNSTMIAAKAAGSVVAIWATERLWKKKRPKLAIASGVLLNVVSGLVVMNNYRIMP